MILVLNKTQKFDVGTLAVQKEISSSLISIFGILNLLFCLSVCALYF